MLDTDICIYIIKHKPLCVLERFNQLSPDFLSMSVITYAELMNGAKKSSYVELNAARLQALSDIIEIRAFDKPAAITFGDVRSRLEKRGEIIGAYDLLIASHALSLDRILVTNNEKEFTRVEGLKIENWTT
jgi:tRNA(fMet)-specific endonuclease VapC